MPPKHRPAAAPKRLLRRPAAAPAAVGAPVVSADREFEAGREVRACDIPPGGFEKGCQLVVTESCYYGTKAELACIVEKEELEGGERELIVQMLGTKHEELLKIGTASRPCLVRLHLCKRDCPQQRLNPDLVHVEKVKKLGTGPFTWEENLKLETGLEALHQDHDAWKAQVGKENKKAEKSSSSSSRKKKKKRKKKEKKEKEKKKRIQEEEDKKRSMGEQDSPGKKRRKEQVMGGKTIAKKSLIQVFSGTGMDPDSRLRKKLMKKVKRKLRKGKVSSTSSSSSSSSASESIGGENLLDDRSRVHRIASLGPGLLCAMGLESMKPHLIQVGNTGWEDEVGNLPPLLGMYQRTYMATRLTGGIQREFATLSWIGDLLIQGRVAEGLDCLFQRLKSIEMVSKGEAWQAAQKLELVPTGDASLAQRPERQMAQKENKLDRDAKGDSSTYAKGKGKTKEKWSERGNDKGKGKNKGKEEKPKAAGQ